jgi:hypothetical protein
VDSNGRTIWIADAHCDDGKRFVVRADEKLTAFLELESAIRAARCWLNAYSSTRSSPLQSAGSSTHGDIRDAAARIAVMYRALLREI